MSKEELNKLIAEFMGEINSIEDKISFTKNCSTDELKYHTSWDWLMPVVEKINNLKTLHFIVLEGKRVQWIVEDDESMPIVYQGKPMIEMTYQAVVEFINFYNKNCI